MSTTQHRATPADQFAGHNVDLRDGERRTHRSFQETKAALKTTELYLYLAAVVGVLVASYLSGDDNASTGSISEGGDYFAADKAWLYIAVLTVGYLISRGLAKSGSRTDANATA